MDCPGCAAANNVEVEMTDLPGDHETLRECAECGGLWINAADLNRILLHNNLAGLEAQGGKVDANALTGQCPDCQVDLVRVDGGDRSHPLHYDTCESCGGIFLESEFKDARDAKAAEAAIIEFFRRFDKRKTKAAI
jgi:Zn-finger nucleic acid-binding protein